MDFWFLVKIFFCWDYLPFSYYKLKIVELFPLNPQKLLKNGDHVQFIFYPIQYVLLFRMDWTLMACLLE